MKQLERIENQFANIESIRSEIIKPKLIQLHSGIEGFESPETYGVYRNTGGKPLGVVGSRYKPMDLEILLDSITQSIEECNLDLDLSKLKYREYCDGSKVSFTIDLPTKEIIGSPMVGDIINRRLEFRTGFDGLTKSSITEFYRRVWCENGCSSPKEQSLAFKNTLNNHIKIYNLCNYIETAITDGDQFITNLGNLAEKQISPQQQNEFIRKVTGYGIEEYKELTTRKRNILDAINASVAIEMNNTGANMFSLYNGITRYITHDRAGGEEEKLIYNSTNTRILNKALTLALSN